MEDIAVTEEITQKVLAAGGYLEQEEEQPPEITTEVDS